MKPGHRERIVQVMFLMVVTQWGCTSGRAELEGALQVTRRELQVERRGSEDLREVVELLEAQVALRDRSLAEARARLDELSADFGECGVKLRTLEMTSMSELVARNEGLEEQLLGAGRERRQAERAALNAGMLAVWESLLVEAVPIRRRRLFRDDHFLRFRVMLRDHMVVEHLVETRPNEAGFAVLLGGLVDIVSLAASLALIAPM